MRIAGFQKHSMVDFPGKLAAVVFTPGCNMNCYYCHNRVILGPQADAHLTDREEVLAYLFRRKGLLEGLVITGGEPTLQKGLKSFILEVRSMGYPVKLDTNGTCPGTLQALVQERLVDYVAMDLKAPWQRYDEMCGAKVDTQAVQQSIQILLAGHVHYEFRTTFAPDLTQQDVLGMARGVQGAERMVLQQYRKPQNYLPDDHRIACAPHTPDYIRQTAQQIRSLQIPCDVRGI